MCNNSVIKITHCFWWDLRFSVTLLQWPQEEDAQVLHRLPRRLGRIAPHRPLHLSGNPVLESTKSLVLYQSLILMNKYASPCLFWVRAEFLFDPLLHLHKSLLHAITRFITHAFMFYYTWVGSYYTWVGSYYTLITRSHASYYTLPWFLLHAYYTLPCFLLHAPMILITLLLHAPMILITRSYYTLPYSYYTLPWFLLHAITQGV
jgi:hypothetical protein